MVEKERTKTIVADGVIIFNKRSSEEFYIYHSQHPFPHTQTICECLGFYKSYHRLAHNQERLFGPFFYIDFQHKTCTVGIKC